jgi:16S rRNA G966 N2-methylase RsmD
MVNVLKDNQISISEDEWKELNETLTKEEIKLLISETIEKNEVPLPMREIMLEEAFSSFEAIQKETKPLQSGHWFSRYDYSYPFLDMYFPVDRSGNVASDMFSQQQRWMCDSINSPSPYRTWNTEKFRLTLLNALWTLKFKKIDATALRSAIGLRKYIAAQFRPATAKSVYEMFDAKNVLDISAGWGDRLTGFLAASNTRSYLGIDPNEKMVTSYDRIEKAFNNSNKKVEIVSDCAEHYQYRKEQTFDFIFTSPPYFNIERYTQEDNQSFKRYRKLHDWLELFLFKSLENAWNQLEQGGFLVINISDVYSNHTVNKICDPMNDFIKTLPQSHYYGAIGYQMHKRPNSGALKDKEGVFCEPMWVWEKKSD